MGKLTKGKTMGYLYCIPV